MSFKNSARLIVLASTLAGSLSIAADANEGAMLKFKIASESPRSADGSADRKSVETRVLVAFNEKFAMQQSGLRVELVAADQRSAAGVTVSVYDARGTPLVLLGSQELNVPVGGSNSMHMTGADGTAYDLSVQFDRARLPAIKP